MFIDGLTALERRVLLTHWYAKAYNLCIKKPDLLAHCWNKTGASLGIDKKTWEKIKPEGFPKEKKYSFLDFSENPEEG